MVSSNEYHSISHSLEILEKWIVDHQYKGYDPFDGLSAFIRKFTFRKNMPQRILQQSIRRFPFNLRPILGITPHTSTKGMGFMGSGYLKLYQNTGNEIYKEKAAFCFDWLINNASEGYSGYCWGNSFDYISRAFYLPKYAPTLVWTALIGHHFAEAYRLLKEPKYYNVLQGIGEFIVNDIPVIKQDKGICLSYIVSDKVAIHNANFLGARILAEIFSETGIPEYKELAYKALLYGMSYQHPDGSWYYGEEPKYHWVDNWHTAYNLDSIYDICNNLDIYDYDYQLNKGLDFYTNSFFNINGAPKYYWDRDYIYDIQSSSQSIDTLALFSDYNKKANLIELAIKVAFWTIRNMQDSTGYFYLWKSKYFTNKTPTFHWGCATMLRALSNLLLKVKRSI